MNEPSAISAGVQSRAEVATPKAGRYLQQLAKHFQHKRPVNFNERSGHIAFSVGECRMEADAEILRLSLTAPDAAQMAQLQNVVARHLLRFAFREAMQIDWQPA